MLDPKPSDLTLIRMQTVRTEYRCIDIRRIMVIGNSNNIIAGTELNLRQDVKFKYKYILICIYRGIVKILSVSM
ncbi:hypothetical protein VUR80DRAFT_9995 [Thermomyces stellatus]